MSRGILLLLALAGCAAHRPFGPDAVWVDPDQRPVERPPELWLPNYWTALDHAMFRPMSRFFEAHPDRRAVNANAFEEVPDSSWYTNRLSLFDLTPEQVALGPCDSLDVDPGPFTVVAGKIGGIQQGFFVEEDDGTRHLLKLDAARFTVLRAAEQDHEPPAERGTAADVVGSLIHWAGGYNVPCNRIVRFDPDALRIADDAEYRDSLGRMVPLTREIVRDIVEDARGDDGLVRAVASRFVDGEPIGPWTFEGVHPDDPNDVVPHEDRRELRGLRLFAAWLDHFDARDSNTLASFLSDDTGRGFVRHYLIDFGDSLGERVLTDALTRRIGHTSYFDPGQVLSDLATLGLVEQPWDRARITPGGGETFPYYDVDTFEPLGWKAGTPNLAFRRMEEADAYWAARTIARFTDDHLAAIVDQAELSDPDAARYLLEILAGRRDAIARAVFSRMTPLDRPAVRDGWLVVEDVAVAGGYADPALRRYEVRVDGGRWRDPDEVRDGHVRVDLAGVGRYGVIEARVRDGTEDPARPVAFHVRRVDGALRPVGIVR